MKKIIKSCGLSTRANYTNQAAVACRRSPCQLLRIVGVAWSARRIPRPYFRFSIPGKSHCKDYKNCFIKKELKCSVRWRCPHKTEHKTVSTGKYSWQLLLSLSCSKIRQTCFMQQGRMNHRVSRVHRLCRIVRRSNLGSPDQGSPFMAFSVLSGRQVLWQCLKIGHDFLPNTPSNFLLIKLSFGPHLRYSGQSAWLLFQRSWFDSRRYQIFWRSNGLERDSLSLVNKIEEILFFFISCKFTICSTIEQ
jgi:hypothetical protein